jgi:hypothetical protein
MTDPNSTVNRIQKLPEDLGLGFLSEASAIYSDLAWVFDALGVDAQFKFNLNLIVSLQQSVAHYSQYQSLNREAAQSLAVSLDEAARLGRAAGLEILQLNARTGAKGNYPLALPLTYMVPDLQEGQETAFHVFRAIFIFDLLDSNPQIPLSWRDKVATQLELATKQVGERRKLVTQIQFKPGDNLDDRLIALRVALEHRLQNVRDKSSDEALLIQALVVLLGSKARLHTNRKPQGGAPSTSGGTRFGSWSGVRLISDIDIRDPDFPGPAIEGVVEVVDEELEVDDSEDDHPDPKYLFLSDPAVEGGGDFQPPLEDLEVNAKRSARWVASSLALTRSAAQHWNTIERTRFLRKWQSLVENPDRSRRELALCIGLIYTTGKELESLLRWRSGADFTISGKFLRTWETPENAYRPNTEEVHAYQETIDRLWLPFPEAISGLLRELCEGSDDLQLFQYLSATEKDLDEEINQTLRAWSENGRHRLIRVRLGAAVRTEAAIRFQNPLVTYLLTGSEGHSAPLIQYYAALPESYLQACWAEIMDYLFRHE